jgi:hypothetical protein
MVSAGSQAFSLCVIVSRGHIAEPEEASARTSAESFGGARDEGVIVR